MSLPCRGDLHHHFTTLKSDLGCIGLFIVYLSSVDNHLLRKGHASVYIKKRNTFRIIQTFQRQCIPLRGSVEHYSLSPFKVKTSQ